MTENGNNKIQSYRDLEAWQVSYELAKDIYRITAESPDHEQYGLTSQMRRCAVSVPSNIAEGFHRQFQKEKIQFYHIGSGSVAELQTQILLSKDMRYIDQKNFELAMSESLRSHKLIYGLIRSTRSRKY